MKSNYKYLYNNNYTEVSDLALASTIQYLGFPVFALNKDPKESPKVSFIFEKSTKLDDSINKYWQGLTTVEPRAFSNIVRELKTRIKTS